MQRFRRVLTLVIPFSFIIGAWWGYYKIEKQNATSEFVKPIHIVTFNYKFSDKLINKLRNEEYIEVNLKSFSQINMFSDYVDKNKEYIDLIIYPSFLFDQLSVQIKFQKLTISNKLRAHISADFTSLPFDKFNTFSLPISWSLSHTEQPGLMSHTEQQIFAGQDLKALSGLQFVWFDLVSVPKHNPILGITQRVIKLMLDKDYNKRLVVENNRSSVLERLNKSNLPEEKKPSYIRNTPLNKLVILDQQSKLEEILAKAKQKKD